MDKVWAIAAREYNAMVRTKAFVVSVILMPILMLGGIIAQKLLEGRIDVTDKRVVIVDGTSRLLEPLMRAAEQRNATAIFDPERKRQVAAKYVLIAGPPAPLTDEARLELSDRVRRHEIFAFVEIPAELMSEAEDASPKAVQFYAENLAFVELIRWVQRSIADAARTQRLVIAGIDPAVVMRASVPVEMDTLNLYERAASGAIRKAEKTSRELSFFVPMTVMMLMFMSVIVTAQPMLNGVIEEKQQRIAEVLLGSANPFQIMMGKLIGNVGVSLTIIAVYLIGGYITASYFGFSRMLPPSLAAWFLLYQIMAVFLFGAIFLAIGAACTDLKEAQSLMTPAMLILILPMMIWFTVLREPLSTFSTVLSLIPPVTPMLMILRMAASASVPEWQPVVGAVLVLIFMFLMVFLAGRIFRIGLLAQGKAPKLRELAQWALRG
ncbi:MAG: ABC transporter permease [Phycisphaerae bacterium]|nr:ABC transporter permease [Phycisphaerae bacterium]